MFIDHRTFERRLKLIRDRGYHVIPLSQATAYLAGQTSAPAAAVVITIDDGWFSTYDTMIPALRRYRYPATLYCDTDNLMAQEPIYHVMARYVAMLAGKPIPQALAGTFERARDPSRSRPERAAAVEELARALDVDLQALRASKAFDYMTPDQLRSCREDGIDVQLHTHNHTLHDMSAFQIEAEITENRKHLAELLHQPPESFTHFCYPSGVVGTKVPAILARLDIASATTLVERPARPGQDPRLLPRFVDGEQLTDVEFEAMLSGFYEVFVLIRHARDRLVSSSPRYGKRSAETATR